MTNSQINLQQGTQQKDHKETKNKKPDMLRRNGPVIKSLESVLRPEESLMVGKICERGMVYLSVCLSVCLQAGSHKVTKEVS